MPTITPLPARAPYIAAIQSPTTLLTLASNSTNFGFEINHDYAVLSVTGSGSSALFQLFNPWGLGKSQPGAITWAQLMQSGDFTQDGDTNGGAAAAPGLPSGEPAASGPGLYLADVFSPNVGGAPYFAPQLQAAVELRLPGESLPSPRCPAARQRVRRIAGEMMPA